MYKGHMDMTNCVGINCGSRVGGWGRVTGGKIRTSVIEQQLKKIKAVIDYYNEEEHC